jgi:hypothetical protein
MGTARYVTMEEGLVHTYARTKDRVDANLQITQTLGMDTMWSDPFNQVQTMWKGGTQG